MPITPLKTTDAFATALKDMHLTETEVKGNIAPAMIVDLLQSKDVSATLTRLAGNLRAFVEPFAKNDVQVHDGLTVDRSARYELTDLANKLGEAAGKLDKIKGGLFGLIMGMVLEDGVLTVKEASQMHAAAKKMLASAPNPADTAAQLRSIMLELEGTFEQLKLFGQGGPTRDEVISPKTQKSLDRMNVLLGGAIAKGLAAGPRAETIDAASPIAKVLKDMVKADGMGRAMLMADLPRLIDGDVGVYDSSGLVGPAKLKMDEQAAARGRAILAFVDALPTSSGKDDVLAGVHRYTTGHFVPPSHAATLAMELAEMDKDDLTSTRGKMQEQLEKSGTPKTFSARNEKAALLEGLRLLDAEIARR